MEKLLADLTVQSLYAKLPTPRMKAIVALHFELGYSQELVAQMFGMKQPSLVDEIALIQRILLGKPYRPRRKVQPEAKREDVQKVLDILGYSEYL